MYEIRTCRLIFRDKLEGSLVQERSEEARNFFENRL